MQDSKRQKTVDLLLHISDDNAKRSLSFSHDFSSKHFRLFEVTKDILSYIQQQGELRLVGDASGDAVLCTDKVTYGLKKVETSNSMCIVAPRKLNEAPHEICEIKKEYYEASILLITKYFNDT